VPGPEEATSPKSLRVLTHLPVSAFERVAKAFPDVEFVEVPQQGEAPEGLAGEVLLTFAWGSPNLPELAKRGVRWIHTIGTGVDRFPLEAVGDRLLTCSRGASAVPIAEWTLAMMLAFEKRLPESWITSPPEIWNRADLGGLYGKTLGLVGLGGIGVAVAQRALAFGMRVRAFRRSAAASPLAGVEVVGELPTLASDSDHLVIAASATPQTRGLVGRELLSRVRPGVHLVNVARGSLLDQEALREALGDRGVARASLDVVEPEPLPEGHWLYTHPRVRLSPHISWSMPGAVEALFDTFAENLRRYRVGEPLEGRVDLARGY
jgi:phosphoglycerate dehydrogenase-like enzyme